MARRAQSLQTLYEQVNRAFPDRDRRSDGWIADSNHPSKSDHTPRDGIVHAIDVDEDNLVSDQKVGRALWEWLLAARPDFVKYVIYEGQIVSSYSHPERGEGWTPGPYSGSNAHAHHIHISAKDDRTFSGKPFDDWVEEQDMSWLDKWPRVFRRWAEEAEKRGLITEHTDPNQKVGDMPLGEYLILRDRALKEDRT